ERAVRRPVAAAAAGVEAGDRGGRRLDRDRGDRAQGGAHRGGGARGGGVGGDARRAGGRARGVAPGEGDAMTAGGDSGGGSSSGGGARLEHVWFPRPVPGNVAIGP